MYEGNQKDHIMFHIFYFHKSNKMQDVYAVACYSSVKADNTLFLQSASKLLDNFVQK